MPDQKTPLIDAIKKEHVHLSGRIALLKDEMRVWSDKGEPDHHLLKLLAGFFKTFPDEIHHKKEDYIYDALIRNGVLERDYLARLRSEHDEMSALTEKFSNDLGKLGNGQSTATLSVINNINGYVAMQELHMADEESQFLPLAESVLPEARFIQISEAIQLDLITEASHQTFRALAAIDADIDDHLKSKK